MRVYEIALSVEMETMDKKTNCLCGRRHGRRRVRLYVMLNIDFVATENMSIAPRIRTLTERREGTTPYRVLCWGHRD